MGSFSPDVPDRPFLFFEADLLKDLGYQVHGASCCLAGQVVGEVQVVRVAEVVEAVPFAGRSVPLVWLHWDHPDGFGQKPLWSS